MLDGRSLAPLLIGSVLVSCALGSCGSSSGAKPRYVAAGEAICSQEMAILHRQPEPATPAQALTYLPGAIAVIHREADRLAALSVPSPQYGQLAGAVSSSRRLGALLAHFLGQLRGGVVELSTYAQVQSQSNALRAQINSSFRHAGLTLCVDSP